MAKNKLGTKLIEWQHKARKGGVCEMCGRIVHLLSVDHIVPSSIINSFDDTGMMQYEDEDNFQLVCLPCNKFKGGQLDKRNPKTKEILLKLLNH